MAEETKGMSNVAALRDYLAAGPHGRRVDMNELKALTAEERQELGDLARVAIKERQLTDTRRTLLKEGVLLVVMKTRKET